MTPLDARPDGGTAIEALAVAIDAWLRQAVLTEERVTAFAFREGGPALEVPPVTSHRYLVGRVLAAAGDPATLRLLAAARDDGVPFATLLQREDLGTDPGDRVALAERIAVAANLGLVGRELEGDRVRCTGLGAALLELVESLEARLTANRTVEQDRTVEQGRTVEASRP